MRKRILEECLRIALRRNTPELHPEWMNNSHFCFVVQGNKIVEWGTNRSERAAPYFGFNPQRHKIHAEVAAMQKARGLLERNKTFEVVNVRLNRQNEIRLSAPCVCCTSFLAAVGCQKTWFTTENGWARL